MNGALILKPCWRHRALEPLRLPGRRRGCGEERVVLLSILVLLAVNGT